MSKMSKACDISPRVRKEVKIRDKGRCIYCGSQFLIELAHIFVPRSKAGLGIKENLACLCHECHKKLDNGLDKESNPIKIYCEQYLRTHYDINRNELKYTKWKGFKHQ